MPPDAGRWSLLTSAATCGLGFAARFRFHSAPSSNRMIRFLTLLTALSSIAFAQQTNTARAFRDKVEAALAAGREFVLVSQRSAGRQKGIRARGRGEGRAARDRRAAESAARGQRRAQAAPEPRGFFDRNAAAFHQPQRAGSAAVLDRSRRAPPELRRGEGRRDEGAAHLRGPRLVDRRRGRHAARRLRRRRDGDRRGHRAGCADGSTEARVAGPSRRRATGAHSSRSTTSGSSTGSPARRCSFRTTARPTILIASRSAGRRTGRSSSRCRRSRRRSARSGSSSHRPRISSSPSSRATITSSPATASRSRARGSSTWRSARRSR